MESFRKQLNAKIKKERNYAYVLQWHYGNTLYPSGPPKCILGGYYNDPLKPHFVLVANDSIRKTMTVVIQCRSSNKCHVQKWFTHGFVISKTMKPIEALHHYSLDGYSPVVHGTYYTRGTCVYASTGTPVCDKYITPMEVLDAIEQYKEDSLKKK